MHKPFSSIGSLTLAFLWMGALEIQAADSPGTDGPVHVIRKIGDSVYVGGSFTRVGGVEANNIARWDGTRWGALGEGAANGVSGPVNALIEGPNGSVLVGGAFHAAGGVVCSNLARWKGTGWSAQSGFDGPVLALEWRTSPTEGYLLVGGSFRIVDGQVSSNLVALGRLEGGEWGAVSQAYQLDGPVTDIRRHELDLWVAGGFSRVNGVEAGLGRVFRGDLQLASESGVRGVATCFGRAVGAASNLLVGGGELRYALAGRSSGILAIPQPGTAPSIIDLPGLEGGSLADAGSLATREVLSILSFESQVLVGGSFRSAGGRLVSNLALWDGRDWSRSSVTLGGGVEGVVRTLEYDGERIWVGGEFSRADHHPVSNLAVIDRGGPQGVWMFPGAGPLVEESSPVDGSRFRVVTGLNGSITTMAATRSQVYVSGSFTASSSGRPVRGLGLWNGADWVDQGPLSFRMAGSELPGYGEQLVAGRDRVYFGGVFTHIGNVGVTNIAYHHGGRWHSLGGGLWNGINAVDYNRRQVRAIFPHESGVFVGGNFLGGGVMEEGPVRGLYNVARYSFTDGRWHRLGGGLHGGFNNSVEVAALAVWGGDLYAAGTMREYEQEDGTRGFTPRGFVRWNLPGQRWQDVPTTGLPAIYDVTVLAATQDYLYAGGTTLGIYRWNGTNWSEVLPRVPNVAQKIWALLPHQQELFAVTASTVDGFHLRRFRSGFWMDISTVAWGFPTGIDCLALRGHELFFGGQFDATGFLPASNFGVADISARSYEEFQAQQFPPGTPADQMEPGADPDGDGLSNEAEFIVGTDPLDPGIAFRLNGSFYPVPDAPPPGFFLPGGAVITFEAMPNRTYGVESRETMDGPWTQFARVPSRSVERTESVNDPRPGAGHRFYRIVTPAAE